MNEKPSRFRFGLRTLFEIVAVVAFFLTLIYYRASASNGRYQFQTFTEPGGRIRHKWVIDTQTGQMWRYSYNFEKWEDESAPPNLAK
jgi:hypothetical protein